MADWSRGYSTFVTSAKIVLPLVALGLLASLFLVSGPPSRTPAIPYSNVEIDEIVNTQRLGEPQYRGTLADGSVLAVTARGVAPQMGNADVILADAIVAALRQTDGMLIELSAPAGGLMQSDRRAFAQGGLEVTRSDGYRLTAPSGEAAIDGLDVTLKGPVLLTGPRVRLEAGGAHLSAERPGREVLVFTGGVKLVYRPEKADGG